MLSLSSCTTLVLLASAVRSSPTIQRASSTPKRDGFTDISYQGLGPGPWDALDFDARSPTAMNGSWFRYVNGGIGVGVTPGSQVGWRLTNDTNTEIVFYWPEDPVFLTASYNGSDADKPTIQNFANVGAATFSTSSNNNASESVDDALWANSTGGTAVKWAYNLAVTNGCDGVDHRTMVVETVDAIGIASTTSGPGEIRMSLNILPINVTIYFADSPDDVTKITYFPIHTLTYKVGAGPNQPSVPPATFDSSVFWCDTD
ncbi:hypothetical protein C8R47DRAFT_1132817 [Mycena vitilis]|nr:hypothetical protein C8R47DRAFT_1132817 [Mycena vitilis]